MLEMCTALHCTAQHTALHSTGVNRTARRQVKFLVPPVLAFPAHRTGSIRVQLHRELKHIMINLQEQPQVEKPLER